MIRSPFERKRWDALRRRLVARWLRGVYRPIESSIRRDGELAGKCIRRILVCRPNHRLGNTILLTPLIQEIERSFPAATIDLVLGGGSGPEVFKTYRGLGRIFCLPRHMAKHPIKVIGLAWKLRRARYDLAIDPCDGSQSGRLLLVIAKARHAVGIMSFDGSNDRGRSESMANAPMHMAQLPVFLLRNALSPKASRTATVYSPLSLCLTPAERQHAKATLDSLIRDQTTNRSAAVLGIFAAATGRKRYDTDWWKRFLEEVRVRCTGIAIVELATENGQCGFSSELPSYSSRHVREVASFISNMSCFVCADCGVMHLASASGATTVGLFSSTDPAKYAPYGHSSRAVETNHKRPEDVAEIVAAIVQSRHRDLSTNSSSQQSRA